MYPQFLTIRSKTLKCTRYIANVTVTKNDIKLELRDIVNLYLSNARTTSKVINRVNELTSPCAGFGSRVVRNQMAYTNAISNIMK